MTLGIKYPIMGAKNKEREGIIAETEVNYQKKVAAVIRRVRPGSIAARLGVDSGDELLSVNGRPVRDVLAYQYLTSAPRVELEIRKPDGQRLILDVEKDDDEDLGLLFAEPTFDGLRRCRNRCLFCFVDQLPPGLRPSLYIKDDDYRYSFLTGNFITLTNLREEDWEEICRFHLSPLYISVHTTNPELRVRMLGNKQAGRIMGQLRRLQRAGIRFHTQIVLCPGLNDGRELDRTLQDLFSFFPALLSIAVVPVGLTKYRDGLSGLRRFTREEAAQVVEQVTEWQRRFLKTAGSRLVYAADEFYLLAGLELPSAASYEGYPQEENGVGLTRKFLDSFRHEVRRLLRRGGLIAAKASRVTVVTGELAAPLLSHLLEEVSREVKDLNVRVIAVPNNFLGREVTVAGLLTGQDIFFALKEAGLKEGETVLFPSVMLKKDEGLFLDGWSVSELKERLGAQVLVAGSSGRDLVRALVRRCRGE